MLDRGFAPVYFFLVSPEGFDVISLGRGDASVVARACPATRAV
jgi:hypothetical protein